MIRLTKEEKANRYDALQVAIKHTIESYKRRRDDCDKRYHEAVELGVIGSYNKGLSDAYCMTVSDLERWVD